MNPAMQMVQQALNDAEIINQEAPRPLMRELPPATPFPVDALGSILGDAVHAIHDKVQAPIAACGQAVLAVATLATQGHANVNLPMGQEKPLSCNFITVLETGGRKTACDTEALKPIRDFEAILREKYEADYPAYDNDKRAYDAAHEAALKRGKGDREAIRKALDALGKPPAQPPHYMLTSTEPTFEGLCQHYTIGHPSLGIFATEGGQFIGGHSMNADAKLRTATGLSNLWDGEAIRRVRKGDGVQELRDKRLAIHLQVQPDVASVMLSDRMLLSQGLLSRFLVTAPDSLAGTRMWKEPNAKSDVALIAYNAHIKAIMQRGLPETFRTISLSGSARALWIEFANSVERDLQQGGAFEPIAGLANKLPEHAARMAGVLALTNDIEASDVSGNQLADGIELAKYYAAEALRLFGASQIDSNLLLAQRLYAWLDSVWVKKEASGLVSLPDIYQLAPTTAIRDQKSARAIVQVLEHHGYLLPHGPAEVDGNKRRETWRVYQGSIS